MGSGIGAATDCGNGGNSTGAAGTRSDFFTGSLGLGAAAAGIADAVVGGFERGGAGTGTFKGDSFFDDDGAAAVITSLVNVTNS